MAHVELHAADQSQRQLEDVRGGCAATRQTPVPIAQEEGGLFLRAGDGDPELVVLIPPAQALWRRRAPQDLRNLGVIQRLGVYAAKAR